jgi:hypothetical protein
MQSVGSELAKQWRRVSAIVFAVIFRKDGRSSMKSMRLRLLMGIVVAAAITAPLWSEELPVLRRTFADTAQPAPPFKDGVFEPRHGETISFIGGTNTADLDRHGFIEAAFHLAWPDRELRLRNLAWQGDSLYYQARPRFFLTQVGDPQPGSIPDHRERTKAGIVFIAFGKMESLEGAGSLPKFLAAYAGLLDQLQPLTGRIVLVAPTPFFPAGPAKSQTETRNAALGKFAAGIGDLARDRDLLLVDLFLPLLAAPDPELSFNGIHLTEMGHRRVAELMAGQLKFPAPAASDANPAAAQSMRQAIERKNRLWQQYYRPTNWAFLFGDRQHVPASRDPVDRDQRWFVREIDALPPLIAETEADIHRYAREAVSKLPAK